MTTVTALCANIPIPFERAKEEKSLRKVTITNMVNVGSDANPRMEKRSAEFFVASDGDVETLLRLMVEFRAASGDHSF